MPPPRPSISVALLRSAGGAMLSVCMFGWTNGNMNTAAPAMREALGLEPVAGEAWREAVWGWCVSIYCAGAIAGCYVSAGIADRLGRKAFLIRSTGVFIAGASLQAMAALGGSTGVAMTLLGRAVVGAASGGVTVVVPAYLGEIAPDHLRGALGVAFQLVVTISMLVAQVVGMPELLGTARAWPLEALLAGAPGVLQLLIVPYICESPRWLAHMGRGADAEHARAVLSGAALQPYVALSDMAGGVGAPQEDNIGAGISAASADAEGAPTPPGAGPAEAPSSEYAGHGGTCDIADGTSAGDSDVSGGHEPTPIGLSTLLASSSLRRKLMIAVATLVTQQLSGINNAFNYSTVYLAENGVHKTVISSVTVLMNIVNVGTTLAATVLVDRSGRRQLLLGSTFAMAACTVVITVGMASLNEAWGAEVATVGIVSFVAAFGLGMGPVPWLLPSELFAQSERATAQGFAALCNWLANGVVAMAFLPLATVLGAYSFLPFGAVLAVYGAYAYAALPETRGTALGGEPPETSSRR